MRRERTLRTRCRPGTDRRERGVASARPSDGLNLRNNRPRASLSLSFSQRTPASPPMPRRAHACILVRGNVPTRIRRDRIVPPPRLIVVWWRLNGASRIRYSLRDQLIF